MRFEKRFPKSWEAEEYEGGDERLEREDGVDLCEWPGQDQRGILRDDDLDVVGQSTDEEEDYYGESRIVGAKYGY